MYVYTVCNNVYSLSFLKITYISVYTEVFDEYLINAKAYVSHILCNTLKIWPQTFQFWSFNDASVQRLVKNKRKLFDWNEIWELERRCGRTAILGPCWAALQQPSCSVPLASGCRKLTGGQGASPLWRPVNTLLRCSSFICHLPCPRAQTHTSYCPAFHLVL